jgi:hypothetical protein
LPVLTSSGEQAARSRACRRHDKLLMLGGVADQTQYAVLAGLGVCSLQLTGMDNDLLYSVAQQRIQSISDHLQANNTEEAQRR